MSALSIIFVVLSVNAVVILGILLGYTYALYLQRKRTSKALTDRYNKAVDDLYAALQKGIEEGNVPMCDDPECTLCINDLGVNDKGKVH